MLKVLASTTAALAILSVSLIMSNRAEAGASASAPTKYSNSTSQVAPVLYMAAGHRHTGRPDVGITEYSSSSVRTHAAKYR